MPSEAAPPVLNTEREGTGKRRASKGKRKKKGRKQNAGATAAEEIRGAAQEQERVRSPYRNKRDMIVVSPLKPLPPRPLNHAEFDTSFAITDSAFTTPSSLMQKEMRNTRLDTVSRISGVRLLSKAEKLIQGGNFELAMDCLASAKEQFEKGRDDEAVADIDALSWRWSGMRAMQQVAQARQEYRFSDCEPLVKEAYHHFRVLAGLVRTWRHTPPHQMPQREADKALFHKLMFSRSFVFKMARADARGLMEQATLMVRQRQFDRADDILAHAERCHNWLADAVASEAAREPEPADAHKTEQEREDERAEQQRVLEATDPAELVDTITQSIDTVDVPTWQRFVAEDKEQLEVCRQFLDTVRQRVVADHVVESILATVEPIQYKDYDSIFEQLEEAARLYASCDDGTGLQIVSDVHHALSSVLRAERNLDVVIQCFGGDNFAEALIALERFQDLYASSRAYLPAEARFGGQNGGNQTGSTRGSAAGGAGHMDGSLSAEVWTDTEQSPSFNNRGGAGGVGPKSHQASFVTSATPRGNNNGSLTNTNTTSGTSQQIRGHDMLDALLMAHAAKQQWWVNKAGIYAEVPDLVCAWALRVVTDKVQELAVLLGYQIQSMLLAHQHPHGSPPPSAGIGNQRPSSSGMAPTSPDRMSRQGTAGRGAGFGGSRGASRGGTGDGGRVAQHILSQASAGQQPAPRSLSDAIHAVIGVAHMAHQESVSDESLIRARKLADMIASMLTWISDTWKMHIRERRERVQRGSAMVKKHQQEQDELHRREQLEQHRKQLREQRGLPPEKSSLSVSSPSGTGTAGPETEPSGVPPSSVGHSLSGVHSSNSIGGAHDVNGHASDANGGLGGPGEQQGSLPHVDLQAVRQEEADCTVPMATPNQRVTFLNKLQRIRQWILSNRCNAMTGFDQTQSDFHRLERQLRELEAKRDATLLLSKSTKCREYKERLDLLCQARDLYIANEMQDDADRVHRNILFVRGEEEFVKGQINLFRRVSLRRFPHDAIRVTEHEGQCLRKVSEDRWDLAAEHFQTAHRTLLEGGFEEEAGAIMRTMLIWDAVRQELHADVFLHDRDFTKAWATFEHAKSLYEKARCPDRAERLAGARAHVSLFATRAAEEMLLQGLQAMMPDPPEYDTTRTDEPVLPRESMERAKQLTDEAEHCFAWAKKIPNPALSANRTSIRMVERLLRSRYYRNIAEDHEERQEFAQARRAYTRCVEQVFHAQQHLKSLVDEFVGYVDAGGDAMRFGIAMKERVRALYTRYFHQSLATQAESQMLFIRVDSSLADLGSLLNHHRFDDAMGLLSGVRRTYEAERSAARLGKIAKLEEIVDECRNYHECIKDLQFDDAMTYIHSAFESVVACVDMAPTSVATPLVDILTTDGGQTRREKEHSAMLLQDQHRQRKRKRVARMKKRRRAERRRARRQLKLEEQRRQQREQQRQLSNLGASPTVSNGAVMAKGSSSGGRTRMTGAPVENGRGDAGAAAAAAAAGDDLKAGNEISDSATEFSAGVGEEGSEAEHATESALLLIDAPKKHASSSSMTYADEEFDTVEDEDDEATVADQVRPNAWSAELIRSAAQGDQGFLRERVLREARELSDAALARAEGFQKNEQFDEGIEQIGISERCMQWLEAQTHDSSWRQEHNRLRHTFSRARWNSLGDQSLQKARDLMDKQEYSDALDTLAEAKGNYQESSNSERCGEIDRLVSMVRGIQILKEVQPRTKDSPDSYPQLLEQLSRAQSLLNAGGEEAKQWSTQTLELSALLRGRMRRKEYEDAVLVREYDNALSYLKKANEELLAARQQIDEPALATVQRAAAQDGERYKTKAITALKYTNLEEAQRHFAECKRCYDWSQADLDECGVNQLARDIRALEVQMQADACVSDAAVQVRNGSYRAARDMLVDALEKYRSAQLLKQVDEVEFLISCVDEFSRLHERVPNASSSISSSDLCEALEHARDVFQGMTCIHGGGSMGRWVSLLRQAFEQLVVTLNGCAWLLREDYNNPPDAIGSTHTTVDSLVNDVSTRAWREWSLPIPAEKLKSAVQAHVRAGQQALDNR